MANVFEQPWLLLIIAGITMLVLLFYRPKTGKLWLWALPVITALAAFGLDYLVKTDREKVKTVISHIVTAVQNEDINAIGPLLADNYRDSFNESKRLALMRLNSYLDEPIIERNVLGIQSLHVNSPGADAAFTVRVVFDQQGSIYEYQKQMIFKLEADLIKQGDDWYFIRIELIELNLRPLDWQHMQSAFRELSG